MRNLKLSKREYNRQKGLVEGTLTLVSAEIERLEDKDMTSEEYAEWLSLCDAQYDCQQELRDLEQVWSRRNWTHGDWTLRALVFQNID